jgi:hypothetical protein
MCLAQARASRNPCADHDRPSVSCRRTLHAYAFLALATRSGLDFTAQALRRSQTDKSEELTVSFTKAYEGTLRKYHNFVVKGAFGVSFAARCGMERESERQRVGGAERRDASGARSGPSALARMSGDG